MFTIDECRNFWKDAYRVFGNIYLRITPMKDKPITYFMVFNKQTDTKKFYRITNNFFIEKA